MASETDFTLAIENLTVSFDGFKAVDDLTLYLDKNELHVVIGPNGAGKTTVLDLICGKTKATSGSIKFLNKEGFSRKSLSCILYIIYNSRFRYICISRIRVGNIG